MKTSILTTICVVCLTGIVLATSTLNISGIWVCDLKLPDGNAIGLTYNFKQDQNKVIGKVDSPEGELTIENGTITNDTLKFNLNIQGYDFPHSGKIYPDSIAMDIISHGAKLHTCLVRR